MTRSPHEPRHGDTWTHRPCPVTDRVVVRAVIVASNDWEPPAKGSHESDVGGTWNTCDDYPLPGEDQERGRGGNLEFDLAAAWSHDEEPIDWSRTPDSDRSNTQ
jgi:hypothetical protein